MLHNVCQIICDVTTMSLVMRKPTLSLRYANNKGANQFADLYSLIEINAYDFNCSESKMAIQTVTRL